MSASTRHRGRPRSESVRDGVLEAAFAVLAERGYAGMSFEAVAVKSGAGRATLYRWWPRKADLAVAAFFHATKDDLAFPDTGSVAEDFRQQITELARLLRGSRGVVFAAMLGGSRTDPDLARALGDEWLTPRRAWGFERMTRAVDRGACRPGIDVAAALGILYGPLYTPLLFGQDIPSEAGIVAHLTIALPAIFTEDRQQR